MDFDAAFVALIGNEGRYSNDAFDPGGETMWGVSARVARRWGYTGTMKELPLQTAKEIAKSEYWVPSHCDELPDQLRFDMLDVAYNSGVHEAIVLLQRAMGVAPADGVWGPKTQGALRTFETEPLRRLLSAARLDFLTDLPGWPHDGRGWAKRIAANLRR